MIAHKKSFIITFIKIVVLLVFLYFEYETVDEYFFYKENK